MHRGIPLTTCSDQIAPKRNQNHALAFKLQKETTMVGWSDGLRVIRGFAKNAGESLGIYAIDTPLVRDRPVTTI